MEYVPYQRIECFIASKVVAKQGDRVARRVGLMKGGIIRHYADPDVKRNAADLAALMAPYTPREPLSGPVRVELVFEYPWKRETPMRDRKGEILKTSKPDLDNLAKQMLDVIEGLGWIKDDAQVGHLDARKAWTGRTGVQVKVAELAQGSCR